jgi:hypothetical protein
MQTFFGPAEGLRYVAILLAILAAVALAFGAQFQNNEVGNSKDKSVRLNGLKLKNIGQLFKRPQWLSGLGLTGLAIVLQLGALSLAPLIVVQPIGAIALVITYFLNAKVTKTAVDRSSIIAIILCTAGIAGFVVMASAVAHENVLTDDALRIVLAILVGILALFAILHFGSKKSASPLTYIVGAGVLYGFVATLAKVVILRIYSLNFEWLTLLCLIALLAAMTLGGWFVQNAYAKGPPDLVIAGLTVIDPMVAVTIAIIVLGEAQESNLLTSIGFAITGMISVAGVWLLSKVHPELANKAKSQR